MSFRTYCSPILPKQPHIWLLQQTFAWIDSAVFEGLVKLCVKQFPKCHYLLTSRKNLSKIQSTECSETENKTKFSKKIVSFYWATCITKKAEQLSDLIPEIIFICMRDFVADCSSTCGLRWCMYVIVSWQPRMCLE